MNSNKCKKKLIVCVTLIFLFPVFALSQPAPRLYHYERYFTYSGLHNSMSNETISVFSELVTVSEAPWLQIIFAECNLGNKSYFILKSVEDGSWQKFDNKSIKDWQLSSGYFNGDGVELELFVGSGDKNIFYKIKAIMVGERVSNNNQGIISESICGSVDNRTASTDAACGRIEPVGCTGWIASNGVYLTAGHCASGNMYILEFNVPASDPDGTVNHPPLEDQYQIIQPSIDFTDGGLGNDWAVFDCRANSNTGLLPVQAQMDFYRMSRDYNPSTVRITGYGVDGPSPDFGDPPPNNADNATQQTHSGPYNGETVVGASEVYLEYEADTQPGNSGSQVIVNGTDITIGIHAEGGCTSSGGSNKGTSFENDDLENAIQTFPGTNVVYLDNGHPTTVEDGTVFRPYDTIIEASSAVSSGGILSIVAGYYNENIIINRPMTITAPVGVVRIGTSSSQISK